MRRSLPALVLYLMVALAGCGSSGNSTGADSPAPSTVDPILANAKNETTLCSSNIYVPAQLKLGIVRNNGQFPEQNAAVTVTIVDETSRLSAPDRLAYAEVSRSLGLLQGPEEQTDADLLRLTFQACRRAHHDPVVEASRATPTPPSTPSQPPGVATTTVAAEPAPAGLAGFDGSAQTCSAVIAQAAGAYKLAADPHAVSSYIIRTFYGGSAYGELELQLAQAADDGRIKSDPSAVARAVCK